MKADFENVMYRLNCMTADLDSLYHQAALKLGMSDSVLFLLYLVYAKGGRCPLSEIRRATNISKQTLNSAIRKLEKDGTLYLEPHGGRTKDVCLTEAGKHYADSTIARLFCAEFHAFHTWTPEEVEQYLNLMEKYNRDFRTQIEKM